MPAGSTSRYGVALIVYPGDTAFWVEWQRAPDSGGSPDEPSAVTAGFSEPGQSVFVDERAPEDVFVHYRCRHVREGYTPGGWSAWIRVKAVLLPDVLPEIKSNSPTISMDLVLDETDGTVDLVIDGEPEVGSVKWASSTTTYPDPASWSPTTTDTDSAGNVTITDAFTLTGGQTGYVTAEFYTGASGSGTLLGTLRKSEIYTLLLAGPDGTHVWNLSAAWQGRYLLATWDNPTEAAFSGVELRVEQGTAAGTSWATSTTLVDRVKVEEFRKDTLEFDSLDPLWNSRGPYTFRLRGYWKNGAVDTEQVYELAADAAPDASGLVLAYSARPGFIQVKVTGLAGSNGTRLVLLADDVDPPTLRFETAEYDPDEDTEVRMLISREPDEGIEPGNTIYVRVRVTDDLSTELGDADETATDTTAFASDGSDVGLEAGAPTNAPTVPNTAVQWIQQSDGTVMAVLTIDAYSQGSLRADALRIYAREGGGTAFDKATDVANNSWFPLVSGQNLPRVKNLKPGATYSFGVSAWRKHAPDGSGATESETSIVSPSASPDWQDLPAPESNTTGNVGGEPGTEVGPGGKRAFDGTDIVSGVPNWKGTSRVDGLVASTVKDGSKRAANSLSAGLDTNPRFDRIKRGTALMAANRTSAPDNYTPPLLRAYDNGASAAIDVASFTLRAGSDGLGYGSGSVTGLSFSTQYFVYLDDADLSGDASPSYQATTDESTILSSEGRVYVGAVTTPADGGADQDEDDSGGGVGGGCVAVDSWIDADHRANEIAAGHPLDIVEGGDRGVRAAWAVGPIAIRPRVRLRSRTGVTLRVSVGTPCDLEDGRSLEAWEIDGEELYVERPDGTEGWEPCTAEPIGEGPVVLINGGGVAFLAGDTRDGGRISTHNALKIQ